MTLPIEKPVRKVILRSCLMVMLCLPGPVAAAPPKRIVSLNLCADQLLLALADRSQIAALTRFARDTAMSAEAARAGNIRTSRGSAEDVLALNPDLILASPGRRSGTMAALKGQHYQILELPSAESYDAIITQIRQVADAVGHPERGVAMIRTMNAELAAIPKVSGRPIAAYYQRRGYLTGTGTLIDDLMQRLGLRNLAGVLGLPALSRLSVEQMVMARPDYLIVESATDSVTDQGTEMLHHPALADIPRLKLPQAWTVCGGPSYVRAAKSLSAQLRAR
ncbi:ABC transporter substrate-binding protein [Sphingobium boeckii]|uniref:Iron complex transport system substrate-binding protein n=1 Tax=Sphingobium boeckii TaxID=1082345 RepID=A0A7W9EFY4_9SPHN|nr:iron complex transport system substrate-binding protein [Sphingobium boeckii]